MIVLAYPYAEVPGTALDCLGGELFRTVGPVPVGWPNPTEGPDPVEASTTEMVATLAADIEPGDLLFPMSEEAVLPCAAVVDGLGGLVHGPSRDTALCASDRRMQRNALSRTPWNVDSMHDATATQCEMFLGGWPVVVKGAASSLNEAVWVAMADHEYAAACTAASDGARWYRERMKSALGHTPNYTWMAERFAGGGHFEVGGVVGTHGEPLHTFVPLQQRWASPKDTPPRPPGKIVSYEPAPAGLHDTLRRVALDGVHALGLEWSGFCVEIKGPPWKVIEVNARFGWDSDGLGYWESQVHPATGSHPWLEALEELGAAWRVAQERRAA